jgi:hypothetical protein
VLAAVGRVLRPVGRPFEALARFVARTLPGRWVAAALGRFRTRCEEPDVQGRESWWKRTLSWAVLVALFVAVLLSVLSGLMKALHPPGAPGYGAEALSGRILSTPNEQAVARVVDGWFRQSVVAASLPGGLPPGTVPNCALTGLGGSAAHRTGFTSGCVMMRLDLLLDTLLFVPAYACLLAVLLFRGRREARALDREPAGDGGTVPAGPVSAYQRNVRAERARAYDQVATVALWALAVMVVADVVENVLTWRLLDVLWGTPLATATAGAAPAPARRLPPWPVVQTDLLWAATRVKWIAALVTLSGLVIVGLALGLRAQVASQLARVLRLLRGQLAVVVVLAVALFLANQAPDAIRRWNGWNAAFAIFLAFALATVTWEIGSRVVAETGRRKRREAIPRAAATLLWALLVVATVGMALAGQGWTLAVPAGIALAVWLFGLPFRGLVRSEHARDLPPAPGAEESFGAKALPRLAGSAVLVVIGLAVLRATFGDLVYSHVEIGWQLLRLLPALVLVAAGRWFYVWARSRSESREAGDNPAFSRWGQGVFGVMVACVAVGWLALNVAIGWNVLFVGPFIGTIAMLLAFLLMLSIVLGVLVRAGEKYQPAPAFRALQLRANPVLSLLLVWAVGASLISSASFHDVRTRPLVLPRGGAPYPRTVTIKGAYCRWAATNGLSDPSCASYPPPSHPAAGAVPLIVVASSGGGIKSAFWTDIVLDCLFDQRSSYCGPDGEPYSAGTPPGERYRSFGRSDRILLMSGISGGSVGFAEYAAYLTEKMRDRGTTGIAGSSRWIEDRLGQDYLSAELSWMLFVESPRVLIGFRPGEDRAAIMERAWERGWRDRTSGPGKDRGAMVQGLRGVFQDPHVPLLLLNGTTVDEGCRLNASVLAARVAQVTVPASSRRKRDTGTRISQNCRAIQRWEGSQVPSDRRFAATRDLVDYLCRGGGHADVSLSTAALLSARFPYVSPAGRLAGCPDLPATRDQPSVVDGGYLDDSGGSDIVELWPALESFVDRYNEGATGSCIVPFMVQIDNGYADVPDQATTARPHQLLAPPKTLYAASGLNGRAENARQAAALLFSHPFMVRRASGATAARLATGDLNSRYVHLYPKAHPGTEAPLGWALSKTAMRDLRAQLEGENRTQIDTVRSWLTGLRCG